MFKLVISDDEGKTIIVPLVRDLITIGRQEGNTIRLTERNVSRQHARLVKTDDGYRLEDLDAYNGVKVNGERIKGARDLVDGDKVTIGDYSLALHRESEATTTKRHSRKPAPSAPPLPTGIQPARLVMVSAPAPGAEFSITKDAVRVGRLEELDLCISHRSISREHAEIKREDGAYSVADLGSANGVRINGSLVKKSALKSGDLLDLGQVRFRFVGEGEPYSFEADEVHAVGESAPPAAGNRRARMALVVGLAVLGAGAFAWFSESKPEAAAPVVQPEPLAASVEVEQQQPTTDDGEEEAEAQVVAAREGCRTALEDGRYEEAVKSAQNGLMLDEGDADLVSCRDAAQQLVTEQETFEQASAAYDDGDVDAAYLLLAGLRPNSPFSQDPKVDDVFEAYGKAQLVQARAALDSDPDLAARLAAEVVAMSRISDPLRADAQALRRRTEKADSFPGAARPRRRARAPKKKPAKRAKEPTRRKKPSDEGLMLAESPAKLARSCLARGDQKCAVRALEGRARTAQELALLIETYRALGDTKRAVRSMQQFVKRYPGAPQAGGYQTFIDRNSP